MQYNVSRKLMGLIFTGLTILLTACGEQTTINKVQPPVDTGKVQNSVQDTKSDIKIDETTPGDVKTTTDSSEVAFSQQKKLDTDKVLASYKVDMMKAVSKYPDVIWEDVAYYYSFYDVGQIKAAPYQGQRLLTLSIGCDGPCGSDTIERFAWDEKSGELTWLEALSSVGWESDTFAVLQKNKDSKFTVKALNIPNTLMLPDGKNAITLSTMGADIRKTLQDETPNANGETVGSFVNIGKVAFHDTKWGDIYFARTPENAGCLFLVTPDGVINSYTYDSGLQDVNNARSIKWNDGSDQTVVVSSEYSPLVTGCGIGNSCYLTEKVTEDQLVEAGKATNGMLIYVAKDTKQNKLSDGAAYSGDPNATLNRTFNTYMDMYPYKSDEDKKSQPKLSYADFVKAKAVIYWRDPFGRFSALVRNEAKPAAECGKPVIYLYPEKTIAVDVKVGIDTFTKTVPDYGNNGWNVIAKPNGELKNLADGLVYPYLFWEGTSKTQVALNGGFVVEKKDLQAFLTDSLAKLGLNEKESADFREFWVPKMEAADAPYFQVSFMGTSDFNKVAPLTISPKPDTLIRVFMYYQPLAEKIEMPVQKLTALDRKGFTVIEWGGTSSEAWQIK